MLTFDEAAADNVTVKSRAEVPLSPSGIDLSEIETVGSWGLVGSVLLPPEQADNARTNIKTGREICKESLLKAIWVLYDGYIPYKRKGPLRIRSGPESLFRIDTRVRS